MKWPHHNPSQGWDHCEFWEESNERANWKEEDKELVEECGRQQLFWEFWKLKLRFEIWRKLLRSSVDRDVFLRRGWTRACLNDDGKIPSKRETEKSFKQKVGMESRGHCLLSEAEMSLWIPVRVAGIKLISFGGGAGGERNGSGESDGKNLVQIQYVQFCLWKSQGMCWQGMMHLGTLEVSLKDFDDVLCVEGFPECARIGGWFSYKIGQKWWFSFGNEHLHMT